MILPNTLEVFDLSKNHIGKIVFNYKELTCTFEINPKLTKYDSTSELKWLKERESKGSFSIRITRPVFNKEIRIVGNELKNLKICFDVDREKSGQLFYSDFTIPIAIVK